jgi:fermentation-respiration switch protein FrsA (DUF1100 family)
VTGRPPVRGVRGLLAALVAVAALFAGSVAVRSAQGELRSLEPSPHPVPRPSNDPWLAAASDVALTTPSGIVMRGWHFASRNGAAVVLVHGSDADRTQLLPEARILTTAGYGVLMFDLSGSGESGGQKRRGDEPDLIRLAIDALMTSPDVHPGQIGAYGFSSGAALLSGVVASDERVRAVVLAGCYTDTESHVRHDYGRWGWLSGEPALWAARWAGLVPVHPLEVVPSIAPRPLFFIAGDADPIVPYAHSKRLYEAAREPKELWIVHGAKHGRYADVAPDEYARRLVAFFDRALRGSI